MAGPQDFLVPILDCLDPSVAIPGLPLSFEWPSINEPGFPSLMFGCLSACFAGVNYCLDFLPPDVDDLPSLPSLSLFTAAFNANVTLPNPSFPSLPGISIPPYIIQAAVEMMIQLPFQLTLEIVSSIRDLNLQLPNFSLVKSTLEGIALNLGIPEVNIAIFSNCIALGVVAVFQELS